MFPHTLTLDGDGQLGLQFLPTYLFYDKLNVTNVVDSLAENDQPRLGQEIMKSGFSESYMMALAPGLRVHCVREDEELVIGQYNAGRDPAQRIKAGQWIVKVNEAENNPLDLATALFNLHGKQTDLQLVLTDDITKYAMGVYVSASRDEPPAEGKLVPVVVPIGSRLRPPEPQEQPADLGSGITRGSADQVSGDHERVITCGYTGLVDALGGVIAAGEPGDGEQQEVAVMRKQERRRASANARRRR